MGKQGGGWWIRSDEIWGSRWPEIRNRRASKDGMIEAWMSEVLPAPLGECNRTIRLEMSMSVTPRASCSRPRSASPQRKGRGPTYGFRSRQARTASSIMADPHPAREVHQESLAGAPGGGNPRLSEVPCQVGLCGLRLDGGVLRAHLHSDVEVFLEQH